MFSYYELFSLVITNAPPFPRVFSLRDPPFPLQKCDVAHSSVLRREVLSLRLRLPLKQIASSPDS